VVLR
jgi:hypothetical protein